MGHKPLRKTKHLTIGEQYVRAVEISDSIFLPLHFGGMRMRDIMDLLVSFVARQATKWILRKILQASSA